MTRYERVVLLGFMGAGKSTVGPLLAARLGWRYLDLDAEIERREGRRIPDIFAHDGEAAFRALESAFTSALVGHRRLVLAPGGGWVTVPGRLESLPPASLTVWLQVAPATALARLGGCRPVRPLLVVDEPLVEAERLLAAREPLYRQAALHVPTDGRTPDEVAEEIAGAVGR